MCPCGRARAGCTYHDPALQPAPQVGAGRQCAYDPTSCKVKFGGKTLPTAGFGFALPRAAAPRAAAGPRAALEVDIGGIKFQTLKVTQDTHNGSYTTIDLIVDPANAADFQRLQVMYTTDLGAITPQPWPLSIKWDAVSFEHHPRAWWFPGAAKQDPITKLATFTVTVLP
jgi:hypothetical protein